MTLVLGVTLNLRMTRQNDANCEGYQHPVGMHLSVETFPPKKSFASRRDATSFINWGRIPTECGWIIEFLFSTERCIPTECNTKPHAARLAVRSTWPAKHLFD